MLNTMDKAEGYREGRFIESLLANYPELKSIREDIQKAGDMVLSCYRKGGKVLVCGNGGSAADSEHIVGELMKGFLKKRPLSEELKQKLEAADPDLGPEIAASLQQPLPAISLTSHISLSTAFANDVNPQLIFAQGLLGYAASEDLLIAISTSGNALNVRMALICAKTLGIQSIGLTGKTGGKMAQLCSLCIKAPSEETYRVQEFHQPIYHCICAMVESSLFEI